MEVQACDKVISKVGGRTFLYLKSKIMNTIYSVYDNLSNKICL